MKKIKVLFLEDIGEIAGGPNSLLQLFSKINKDVEIHIDAPDGSFVQKAKKYAHKITIREKIRYEQIKFLNISIPNIYHLIIRFLDAFKIYKYTKKYKIDIVHSNDLDGHLTSWFLCHVFKLKVVWHIRIMTWPKILYKLPRVTKIIFVSDAVKKFSLENKSQKNVSVVYNGINYQDFILEQESSDRNILRKNYNIQDKEFVIGYVSRIKNQKRQKVIIESVLPLIKKGFNIKVIFVGDDSVTREVIGGKESNYFSDLKELCIKNNIVDNIIFTGHQKNTAPYYSIFDCFVFSAINDSNPRVILEAMTSKIPIIANNTGGVVNMLEDGEFGLLCEVDNVNDFTNKIEMLLNNKEIINTEKTFKKLKRDFSLDVHSKNILSIYSNIIKQR